VSGNYSSSSWGGFVILRNTSLDLVADAASDAADTFAHSGEPGADLLTLLVAGAASSARTGAAQASKS